MISRYFLACLRESPGAALHSFMHLLVFPHMREVIFEAAKAKRFLLDLGCGTGLYAVTVSLLRPDVKIVGIDSQAIRLDFAKNLAERLNQNHIQFIRSDILSGNFFEADTYLICDVLFYYPPQVQEKLIEKIARKLPVGGRLILKDHGYGAGWQNICLGWEEKLGQYLRRWLKTEKHPEYYMHGLWPCDLPHRIKQLEACDFAIKQAKAFRGSLLPHVFLVAEKRLNKS